MKPMSVCAVAMLAGALACDSAVGPGACTAIALPALDVTVLDSLTEAPLASGARVIARDGAYADTSVTAPAGSSGPELAVQGLAYERAGRYSVTVERAGYQPWRRDGVVVRRGSCHVETVRLTALLQPTS